MLLRIATRKSPLALWQTEHVAGRLRTLDPSLQIELVALSTRGDEVLDRSLAAIGGKGLFLKELEEALLRGEADLAVHSLKDVPAELDEPFRLAAILAREDSADAFVSNRWDCLASLPQGARVGTSSLRRQVQLRARRPDLQLLDLRGNVNTRLARLDRGDYDAILLAVAGLSRLGLGERVRSRLAAPDWLPAAAQGAICIETRAADQIVAELVGALHDAATARCVTAERALNRSLGGSCQVPIGALALESGDALDLHALVGEVRGPRLLRAQASAPAGEAERLGEIVAGRLLAQGAADLLRG